MSTNAQDGGPISPLAAHTRYCSDVHSTTSRHNVTRGALILPARGSSDTYEQAQGLLGSSRVTMTTNYS